METNLLTESWNRSLLPDEVSAIPQYVFGGKTSLLSALAESLPDLCLLLNLLKRYSLFSRNVRVRSIRPIDAADIITAIGQMVGSGNVRRSAIIIIGDCWDKVYLKAKRWDLGTDSSSPQQRKLLCSV